MQNDLISVIKDKLDIVEVISDRVKLRKAGNRWVGLCPFHSEKTPSFSVSQSQQFFHCFGCGKGGDIFTFVMQSEGLSFSEALELLASRAGVEIVNEKLRDKKNVRTVSETLETANSFFRRGLNSDEGNVARAYLDRRNLLHNAAERFELGWSYPTWDALMRYFRETKISDNEALESGLVIESPKGLYDRFRGRITFPIRDVTGRLIAFGGRLIDGDGAKYVNSPEGAVYSKRKNLYLLNTAKTAIKRSKRAIIVEGYIDAIRMHMCGYPETVGTLGTALTEEQTSLIKRFCDRCYLCYDSDDAGREASLRASRIITDAGLEAYIVSLPRGKDPDALLSEGDRGVADFDNALNESLPFVLYILERSRILIENPQARKSGEELLLNEISGLEDTDIAKYANKLAGALDLSVPQFWQVLNKSRRANQNNQKSKEREIIHGKNKRETSIVPIEAALCALLWRDEEKRVNNRALDLLNLVSNPVIKQIIFAVLNNSPSELERRWHSTGEELPLQIIASGVKFCEELQEEDKWTIVCEELNRIMLKERYTELRSKMRLGSATEDEISEMNKLANKLKGKR
ncbi:MAG: DNA primase [Synergistaceae bacterium]|nr:DNA primase [Synergistaceae bacterium]